MLTPDQVRPHGLKILVRKYSKPEKIGSILLNPAWREDNSRSLWEVIKSSPASDEFLGMELKPDWLVISAPNRGVHCPLIELPDHKDAFFLHAAEIAKIIPWEREDDEDDDEG